MDPGQSVYFQRLESKPSSDTLGRTFDQDVNGLAGSDLHNLVYRYSQIRPTVKTYRSIPGHGATSIRYG